MLKEIRGHIRDCLESVKERIKRNIEDKGRTASGGTASSLSVSFGNLGGTLYGSSSFLAIQRGRKGGRVPRGFVGIIRQWIIDKGISVRPVPVKRKSKYSDEERAQLSAARAIAYTIMKNGTSLYRRGGYDDIYDTAIEEETDKLRPKLLDVFHITIREINQNMREYEKRNNRK
jgi:hypothetical protein